MKSKEWKKYKLEDIADFYDSLRVPLNSRERAKRKGEYPYYGASGIVDYIDSYIFEGEYVLISEDGENLRSRQTPIAFKVDGKFWVNNHAHVIKGKEPFLNDWVVYFFKNLDVNPYITGAVQPKLNRENLQLIEVSLPEFDKARKIAFVLSKLDEKIELNYQINATLEAIAQSIFNEWFVEFNFPGTTGEMVESEMGLIPSGWKVGKLGEILSFRNGKSSPDRKSDYPYPVYGANGIIGFAETYNSTEKNLIIGRVGSFCGAVYYSTKKSFVTENAIIAKSMKDVSSTFCFNLLRALNLNNFKVGSGQPLINQGILSGIDVVIPSVEVMRTYEEIVFSIYTKIYENDNQSTTLAALRDTLLPKLLSGDIDI